MVGSRKAVQFVVLSIMDVTFHTLIRFSCCINSIASMLLSVPQSFAPAYCTAIVLCLLYGGICSVPSVWNRLFPKLPDGSYACGSYLKAGEYGETELNTSWSVFKEPLNAWTSLSYSVFGIVMCYVGINDMFFMTMAPNRIALDPIFSLLYGTFCIYLGIASFLFHASHSEVWRKADAGMTSGSVVPLVMFALWDRLRPPAITSVLMAIAGILLLISLTHGYLPYGSSDVLLPSLVAIAWIAELYPRYGGVVDNDQYALWLQCFFAVAGGALLRAIDIKRKSPDAKRNLILGYFAVLALFGYGLGFTNPVILAGIFAGALVTKFPEKGHVLWHFGSAFALYMWWFMLRVRPGDPVTERGPDTHIATILFFVSLKNAVRRIFMNIPLLPTNDHRDRVRNTIEHIVFSIWGLICLVDSSSTAAAPVVKKGAKAAVVVSAVTTSWLYNAQVCWDSVAVLGSSVDAGLHLFYLARTGAFIEEVLFHYFSGAPAVTNLTASTPAAASAVASPTTATDGAAVAVEEGSNKLLEGMEPKAVVQTVSSSVSGSQDSCMVNHNNGSAILSLASYFTGYLRIGLIVIFLHDVSDIPLDLLKLIELKGWKQPHLPVLLVTIASWLYWRVWIFCSVVLLAILYDSKSLMPGTVSTCTIGHCTHKEMPERAAFVLALLVLLAMNVMWLRKMMIKGYTELFQVKANR